LIAAISRVRPSLGRVLDTGADDLVLCHPETGGPFDASKMRKRFKDAIKAAGVRLC
jgi:hypothetical protein